MRICVPLLSSDFNNIGGNDLPLATHFGLAECFAVVDSTSGNILGECDISGYCPGPCHCPLPDLANNGIDALAGHSMGFRLMQLSRRAKLPVLAVNAQTLSALQNEMRAEPPALHLSAVKCLTNMRQLTPVGKN